MEDKTIVEQIDGNINIGGAEFGLVQITIPARKRKTTSGEKEVSAKVYLRVAPQDATGVKNLFGKLIDAAEKKNAGDGAKLGEKLLSKHFVAAYDQSLVTAPNGDVNFHPEKYSDALFALRAAKAGQTNEDLAASHTLILEQLVALSEIREGWRNDAVGLATDPGTGEPIGHPWDAARWAQVCDTLNSNERLGLNVNFDSFAALTVFTLNLRDRRVGIEKELAERDARKRAAAEKRAAKKAADAPVAQA